MAIEPISSVDGIGNVPAIEALTFEYLHHRNATPAEIQLAEAQAKELRTVEQRVDDGDPIAIDELAREKSAAIPLAAQSVEPAAHPTPAEHPPGAHEEGKGKLIDVYD